MLLRRVRANCHMPAVSQALIVALHVKASGSGPCINIERKMAKAISHSPQFSQAPTAEVAALQPRKMKTTIKCKRQILIVKKCQKRERCCYVLQTCLMKCMYINCSNMKLFKCNDTTFAAHAFHKPSCSSNHRASSEAWYAKAAMQIATDSLVHML